MDSVFIKILNMSITASWLILAVVVLRLVLKKAPKAIICALWTIVAIRLICPFSFESAFSLIPSTETVSQDILYSQTPGITSGIPAINSVVNPVIAGSLVPEVGASVNPLQIWTIIASYVWVIGAAAMLGYAIISYLRIKKKVREGAPLRDNILLCDHIDTPFILGVFRPHIYLPSAMEKERSDYVVAHENAHLIRHDHWWKPLGFLLLAIYWFNPLCWLAYLLLCRDIEMACDEKVVRDWDAHDKKAYSAALLSCSIPRRMVAACPLAFGEVGVKKRVKNVLNYKKSAFWIIIAAVVACVVVAVCFLTNPKDEQDLSFLNYNNLVSLAAQTETLPVHITDESGARDLVVDGAAFARFLDFAEWTPQRGTLRLVQRDTERNSRDSMQIRFNEDLFLRVFDTDTVMIYEGVNGKQRFYRMQDGDYQKALALLDSASGSALTLEDVLALSEKGEALTWADFEAYPYIEGGGGFYIRSYEIDERFFLMIGGPEPSQEPWYVRLVSEANRDEYVDIRTEDVDGFISEHSISVSTMGGAEQTGFIYQTAYAWANYSEDGYDAMVERAENRDTERRYGNIEHLTPVVKLDSKAEFDDFYKEMSAFFDLTQGYDEVGAFNAQAEQYTEEFFAEQSLFIAYLEENTSSNRHEVDEVRIENGILEIRVCQIAPDNFDTAMAGWFISVAVPKADISDCTGYDAYICATNNPNAVFPSGELLRTYAYDRDDNPMHTASVSLYANGEFVFTFAPISSYFGYGAYTIENDRLTLQTDDGNYTYVFDMVNDTLVFDWDASSENTWFSGITDGAIFD